MPDPEALYLSQATAMPRGSLGTGRGERPPGFCASCCFGGREIVTAGSSGLGNRRLPRNGGLRSSGASQLDDLSAAMMLPSGHDEAAVPVVDADRSAATETEGSRCEDSGEPQVGWLMGHSSLPFRP